VRHAENQNDIRNADAWAALIDHLLSHAPRELRAEILAKVKARPDRTFVAFKDIKPEPNWNVITRLKSLIIQVFASDITHDHSAEEAAAILGVKHPFGDSTGCLRDEVQDLILQR
jgi:hypothetical protein